ncbi:CmpA/NrtA family ABC transporter substrate-binding protein [Chamaesiphon polymorphus]|uniref:Nitrate transport protein, NrtC-like protein n=1 Tax=Chamaesiphon polymorphus CCALA 037 TaxID=2107692 RepID=A0A2T1GAW9_9CYAN|nr:CmpA/NrtA family ABC transporter substrate-binding protein [Chamaesiphon polymorphus]PSB54417.1 nitrate transport protein, NrtC-like protein [Chamaesiphon polymorphus CCALA 037]
MKRRQFLQYSTLAAASLTFAACNSQGSTHFNQPPANFGKLEKTDLQIGIVSSLDCLPLVVAKEKGMFKKYGLNVTLVKQPTWERVQQELHSGKLDAVQTLFAVPLWEYFSAEGTKSRAQAEEAEKPRRRRNRRERDNEDKEKSKSNANTVALMGLNINGNSISLGESAWKAGLRPRQAYNSLHEMQESYNKFFRELKQPPGFAIAHPAAMANYTTRYWLGTMGIDAERDLKFEVLAPNNITAGLESGKLIGYATDELFNQQTLADKKAFTASIDRDVWHGHPEKILASLDTWLQANPITAKAMMAAVLEACQYCDNPKHVAELAPVLGKSQYTDTGSNKNWQKILAGNYNYGGFDGKSGVMKVPDFQIFHFQATNYLQQPNHANFLWHSHAAWVLTQMVRWRQQQLTEYPKNADAVIKQLYPTAAYADIAKAFWLNLPKGQLKIEQPEMFIDRVAFDPNKAAEYLNGFELRA